MFQVQVILTNYRVIAHTKRREQNTVLHGISSTNLFLEYEIQLQTKTEIQRMTSHWTETFPNGCLPFIDYSSNKIMSILCPYMT